MTTPLKTDIAIAGAGPSGLMLAIELGCRGVPCVLFDINPQAPTIPKANATSARTMEHYRRRGFSHSVREAGLAADHPQDILYCTRLTGHELARFRMPSRTQAARQTSFGDYGDAAWPTPELPHRAQQFYIEAILREQVARYPSVQTRYGWRVEGVSATASGASLTATHVEGGQQIAFATRYLVGCDGPRSLVRKAMNVQFEGASQEQRDFFGGQMLSIHFRSPDLYARLQHGPLQNKAWMVWVMNPVQRGLLFAVNGVDEFCVGIQLKPGQTADGVNIPQVMQAMVGTGCDDASTAQFSYEVLSLSPWTAGYTLVAEQFRQGPLFIGGDAAHLFTPTGGMGYNTSVDDAVNLGWKLAAVCQGWAPDALLDTYFAERHPIAVRNTRFARAMADSVGKIAMSPSLEDAGTDGDTARAALGEALLKHVNAEFNIPGLQLGLRYQSAIVATEEAAPPPDLPNHYVPSAFPGCRAPHVATEVPGESLVDLLGPDFSLLSFNPHINVQAWQAAARQWGVPLETRCHPDPAARALYGADAVLIRPDHHVAWRGCGDADALAVLARASANVFSANLR